jgi:NitT/TauT family transport system permease protein
MVGRARTVLTAVVAFVLLVVLWELAKLVLPDEGVLLGDTRILPRTDDGAMPHVWTVLARLFEPEVAGAAPRAPSARPSRPGHCSPSASRWAGCCSAESSG